MILEPTVGVVPATYPPPGFIPSLLFHASLFYDLLRLEGNATTSTYEAIDLFSSSLYSITV